MNNMATGLITCLLAFLRRIASSGFVCPMTRIYRCLVTYSACYVMSESAAHTTKYPFAVHDDYNPCVTLSRVSSRMVAVAVNAAPRHGVIV